MLKNIDFGNNFTWGAAISASQTEGAYNSYGKGMSIWDDFSSKKWKIKNRDNNKTACDFYHNYNEDLLLAKHLNIKHFRFSISWPRLMPDGIGAINSEGIDFYNKVIDRCLELDITPWITIYHWDLPLFLEKIGGWTNREILIYFFDYVKLCATKFGDRVKHWMVLNEPMAFTGAGYFLGVHAPGRRGLSNFLPALHHAALCQSIGGRIIKEVRPDAEVGTTFSFSHIEPKSQKEKDILAAKKIDALLNRTFLEPTLGLGYPIKELPFLRKIEKYFLPRDEEKLKFQFDFIGAQVYTREIARRSPFIPYINANIVPAVKRNVDLTAMKWENYPNALYHTLKFLSTYKDIKKIYVTENGAAFPDELINGQINDTKRIEYLQKSIAGMLKAKNEGVNVQGYFLWSLLDNFEWAEGYHPRFGIIHIDYETQKRTIKQSGNWYRDFIEE